MSGASVLAGAHNVAASNNTFNTATAVSRIVIVTRGKWLSLLGKEMVNSK